jgi:proline iminopeptidase
MAHFSPQRTLRNWIARLSVVSLFLAFFGFSQSHVALAQKQGGSVFQAPGASIYYEVIAGGQGTPIIVVNGGPGFDHGYMSASPAWKGLAQKRPIVFYDQRGTGRSGPLKPDQSCTLDDQISDLEALRAHLGYDRADFIGHSWGGFLSMAYAAKYPQHISHLTLVDSVPAKWSEIKPIYDQVFPEAAARRDELNAQAQKGVAGARDKVWRDFLGMLFYSPEKRAEFLSGFSAETISEDILHRISQEAIKVDLEPRVREFNFRAMVLNGRFDTDVTPEAALKLSGQIPQCAFHVFERSGHFPFLEEPDEFAALMENFLADTQK